MATKKNWDRHEIRAEIHRRGSSLTALAIAEGLTPSACRVALCRPLPSGEKAISDFLGVPVFVLWPDRYPIASKRKNLSAKKLAAASQNREAA